MMLIYELMLWYGYLVLVLVLLLYLHYYNILIEVGSITMDDYLYHLLFGYVRYLVRMGKIDQGLLVFLLITLSLGHIQLQILLILNLIFVMCRVCLHCLRALLLRLLHNLHIFYIYLIDNFNLLFDIFSSNYSHLVTLKSSSIFMTTIELAEHSLFLEVHQDQPLVDVLLH